MWQCIRGICVDVLYILMFYLLTYPQQPHCSSSWLSVINLQCSRCWMICGVASCKSKSDTVGHFVNSHFTVWKLNLSRCSISKLIQNWKTKFSCSSPNRSHKNPFCTLLHIMCNIALNWTVVAAGASRHFHSSSTSTSAPAAIHTFTSSGMGHHRRSMPWRVATSKGSAGSATSATQSSQTMYYCRICMIGCAGPQVSSLAFAISHLFFN